MTRDFLVGALPRVLPRIVPAHSVPDVFQVRAPADVWGRELWCAVTCAAVDQVVRRGMMSARLTFSRHVPVLKRKHQGELRYFVIEGVSPDLPALLKAGQ